MPANQYQHGNFNPSTINRRQMVRHSDPWQDPASERMPRNIVDALRWAEFIWLNNGTYRQACSRVARYFITHLNITGPETKEITELNETYVDTLKVPQFLCYAGDTFICYGNVFVIMTMPFKRYLRCDCGFVLPFDEADKGKWYRWEGGKFKKGQKTCPQCGNKHAHTPWHVHDEYSNDVGDLTPMMLNPHQVEIEYVETGSKRYHWKIGGMLKQQVKQGQYLALRDCPMEMIEAIYERDGNFTFHEDMIFHASEPAPAGVYMGGWGLPRVISNFRLAWHNQSVQRMDQAICDDFIGGMRVISPARNQSQVAGGADPILAMGGNQFNAVVQGMIKEHRQDPASWHVSGFPLEYQLFGGEGTQLSPKDIRESILNEWLDASGFPAELFHGTLTVQAAPLALRLFENAHPEINSLYNNLLEWMAGYMTKYLDMVDHKISLEPVRFADDLERKQIMLQLMAGNQISPQTALKTLGVRDPVEELKRTYEWMRDTALAEKEHSDQMQQMADADMIKQEMIARSQGMPPMDPSMVPPAGGAGMGQPMPGAPSAPGQTGTPDALLAEAERQASEIMVMDATARRQALINLKKTDETLHAVVSQKLESMENQAATAGVQAARQGQM